MALLSRRDRRRLWLATFLQSSLALLDLLGIALIGLVAGLSATMVGGTSSELLSRVTDAIGLDSTNLTTVILVLAAAAAVALMSKSILSFYVTRRVFAFLA